MENDDFTLRHETDEKGENMLVRSIKSDQRAYLRFTNKTSRTVDVWWRNYKGTPIRYVKLKPQTYFDVNTFITHPWEFTDAATRESYVIGNKRIFRPPNDIADRPLRTNWNITIGVRSLRKTVLLVIASYINDPYSATELPLPKVLIEDLRQTIIQYYNRRSAIH